MNLVLLKLQSAAFDFGVSKLADLFGTRYKTLLNKLNPDDESIHLTFYEFYHIIRATGKYDSFLELARELGFICIPMPDADLTQLEHINFFDLLMQVSERKGVMCSEFRRAYEDKRITPREAADIKQTIHQLLTLLASVEQGIDACTDTDSKKVPRRQ